MSGDLREDWEALATAAERAAADVGPKVQSFQKDSGGFLDEDHAAAAAKPTVVHFLEVQAAYDILMSEDS